MFTRIAVAVLIVVGLSTTGWAADNGNLQLFKDVQQQVLRYPHFTIFDSVQAQIDAGVVTLSGKVTMPYKRTDIERRVAKIDGVGRVDNRITVLPVSMFDDELRIRIAHAIYGNSNFWHYGSMVNPPIHVVVENGHVTLEGVVNSNLDRVLARSLASGFLSFGAVTNNLRTDAEARAELEKI